MATHGGFPNRATAHMTSPFFRSPIQNSKKRESECERAIDCTIKSMSSTINNKRKNPKQPRIILVPRPPAQRPRVPYKPIVEYLVEVLGSPAGSMSEMSKAIVLRLSCKEWARLARINKALYAVMEPYLTGQVREAHERCISDVFSTYFEFITKDDDMILKICNIWPWLCLVLGRWWLPNGAVNEACYTRQAIDALRASRHCHSFPEICTERSMISRVPCCGSRCGVLQSASSHVSLIVWRREYPERELILYFAAGNRRIRLAEKQQFELWWYPH
jgi:hypothetical protein